MRRGSKRWHQARLRRARVERRRKKRQRLGCAYWDRGRYPDERSIYCLLCDAEMEWGDCYLGCDDGYFDASEDDPINFSPGEMERCPECHGHGGHWWCPTKGCPTSFAWRVFKVHPDRPCSR